MRFQAASAVFLVLCLGLAPQRGFAAPIDDAEAAYARNDYATALRLFRPLAEQGFPVAQYRLALMYAKGQGQPEDPVQAAGWYRKASDQGHDEATYDLAKFHVEGRGVAQNYADGANLYRKSANRGHAPSQLELGALYAGVWRDAAQALAWYRRAADQRNAVAEFEVGRAYLMGAGVAQDNARGMTWVRTAADHDYATAQYILALAYLQGNGVPRDFDAARALLRRAADQGHAAAHQDLAVMYLRGEGVPQSPAEAAALTRAAAERGNVPSMAAMGDLYARGVGVPVDAAQAAAWYLRAAEFGDPDSQIKLGLAHVGGQGVRADAVLAYKWISIAAGRFPATDAQKRGAAEQARDVLAASLQAPQLEQAQRIIATWKPAHPVMFRPRQLAGERVLVPMPAADWKAFAENPLEAPDAALIYVPARQTVDEWKEKVTVRVLTGSATPWEYIGGLPLSSSCAGGAFRDVVQSARMNGLDVAYVTTTCSRGRESGEAELSVVLALRGPENLYVIERFWRGPAYPALPPVAREVELRGWLHHMLRITVCDARDAQRHCPAA